MCEQALSPCGCVAQSRSYSQEVRQALRRSHEQERVRDSPRGVHAALGLGEEPSGKVWPGHRSTQEYSRSWCTYAASTLCLAMARGSAARACAAGSGLLFPGFADIRSELLYSPSFLIFEVLWTL